MLLKESQYILRHTLKTKFQDISEYFIIGMQPKEKKHRIQLEIYVQGRPYYVANINNKNFNYL